MLLNFAILSQLRGEVKSAVEERWTSEELRLSENDSDSHYPLIVQISPLEMPSSDLRERSAAGRRPEVRILRGCAVHALFGPRE